MITSLRLVNFKNFADETLRVGPFTVIVGAKCQRQEQHPRCLPLPTRHRTRLHPSGDSRREVRCWGAIGMGGDSGCDE